MKIVTIITRSDSVGGAHIHVRDLTLALQMLGYDVTVLVGGEGPFLDILRRDGIRFRSLRFLRRPINIYFDLRALYEIISTVRGIRPDIITTHSSKAGWLGRLAGRLLGIPTIFTAHGWAFSEGVPPSKRRIFIMAERIATPLCKRVITVSDYDRDLAIRTRVASIDKTVTVHNGVPDVENRCNHYSSPVRIIMVARFDLQKNHVLLLHALSLHKDLDWTLDIVGDGPLRPKVEQICRQLGLEKRVRFLGTRDDVAELAASCQIFALISHYEGFPLSILEAMRAGLPIVASDVGGVREAVSDGKNGYLIPRGELETLANRLRELICNPNLRDQMGAQSRTRFEKYFTLHKMVEKTVHVYMDVLSNT